MCTEPQTKASIQSIDSKSKFSGLAQEQQAVPQSVVASLRHFSATVGQDVSKFGCRGVYSGGELRSTSSVASDAKVRQPILSSSTRFCLAFPIGRPETKDDTEPSRLHAKFPEPH